MKITILAVGKIKEAYLQAGIREFLKRLGAYAEVEMIEVADEKAPETLSSAQMKEVLQKEGDRLLARLPVGKTYVLAIDGKRPDSEMFARMIEEDGLYGQSHLNFVIGGSLGLSQDVLAQADGKISFGPMTFPHQLMRLMLLEQIYRAFRIINHHPYHK